MKIFYQGQKIPGSLKGSALALGNFDGVHRGHQAVLDMARVCDGPLGAMVFEPHPREFFRPEKPVFRLTPLETRLAIFEALGVDLTIVMTFDKILSQMSAEDFVANILIDHLGICHAVAGYDFHFGRDRTGTPEFLMEAGKEFGFGVSIIAPLADHGAAVSSSAIRALLEAGEVASAAEKLGYHWFVRGEVIKGDQRGRTLGFPTANIVLPKSNRLRHGIYAVRLARLESGEGPLEGVASFGVRPTFGGGEPVLETFIFDFSDDIYGEKVDVILVDYIRPELRFDGADALVRQMKEDAEKAQQILDSIPLLGPEHINLN